MSEIKPVRAANLEVKYEAGHSYQEEWRPADVFCPNCASREVWERQGDGDYYLGSQLLCTACGVEFYLPNGVALRDNWQNKQRLDAIKGLLPPEDK